MQQVLQIWGSSINYLPQYQLLMFATTNQWLMECKLRRPPNRMLLILGEKGGKKCIGVLNTPNYHHYHNSASFRKSQMIPHVVLCVYNRPFARMCYTALWLNHGSPQHLFFNIVQFAQLSKIDLPLHTVNPPCVHACLSADLHCVCVLSDGAKIFRKKLDLRKNLPSPSLQRFYCPKWAFQCTEKI